MQVKTRINNACFILFSILNSPQDVLRVIEFYDRGQKTLFGNPELRESLIVVTDIQRATVEIYGCAGIVDVVVFETFTYGGVLRVNDDRISLSVCSNLHGNHSLFSFFIR